MANADRPADWLRIYRAPVAIAQLCVYDREVTTSDPRTKVGIAAGYPLQLGES